MMNSGLLNRIKKKKNSTIKDNLSDKRRKRGDQSLKDLYAVNVLKIT